MKLSTTLAASALALTATFGSITLASADPGEQVCAGTHLSDADGPSHVYTAPPGQLVSSWCVKAGSIKQGNGPEYHTVTPPATSVTISHSSGKDISHYSVVLVPAEPDPSDDPSDDPSEDPSEEPSEEPSETPTVPVPSDTGTPTVPVDPTDPVEPTDPVDPTDPVEPTEPVGPAVQSYCLGDSLVTVTTYPNGDTDKHTEPAKACRDEDVPVVEEGF